MPVTVRCPCCSTSLTAPDELVGTSARCEDCGQTFVVRRPKAKAAADDSTYPYRYGGLEAKEPDDRDDDRPRRRRPARRSNTAAVLIAAVAVFGLLLVMVAGAGYWVLATRKQQPEQRVQFVMPPPVVGGPVFPAAQQPNLLPIPNDFAPPQMPGMPAGNPGTLTLSNPQWGGGGFGDFRVDYAFAGNQRPIGMGFMQLVFQGPNGDRGTADLHVFEPRGTLSIHVIGPMRQRGGPVTLWVEQGGFPGPFGQPGAKISNTVTLN